MEQEFIENELIILTKATIDKFLKEENPADLIALYTFFYYTAKWQKTNIVKATQGYVKRGLGWGIDRLNKSEKKLCELGLIEKIQRRNSKGSVTGWFVKVNYVFKKGNVEKAQQIIQTTQNPLVAVPTSGFQETNALSTNNINALSTNKEILSTKVEEPKQEEVKVTLNTDRGKSPVTRLMSLYSHLFNHLYGFNPKSAMFGPLGKVFKETLINYSEIQIACLLIVFFNWKGMGDNDKKEEDWLINNAHSIFIFKSGLAKYEVYARNVAGWVDEFDNDTLLYPIVRFHLQKIE